MIDTVRRKLEQGQYLEVEEIYKEVGANYFRDILMNIAYEFVSYIIQKQENAEWINLAVDIMLNPLCFIEGAYSIALFHARELLSIDRNAENLERILFFYNIPERMIDEEEARCIAEELLAIESNNKVAFQIIH